jgi:hypothetical protein
MDFENTAVFILALQTSLEASARKHNESVARLESLIASLEILLGRAGAKP